MPSTLWLAACTCLGATAPRRPGGAVFWACWAFNVAQIVTGGLGQACPLHASAAASARPALSFPKQHSTVCCRNAHTWLVSLSRLGLALLCHVCCSHLVHLTLLVALKGVLQRCRAQPYMYCTRMGAADGHAWHSVALAWLPRTCLLP